MHEIRTERKFFVWNQQGESMFFHVFDDSTYLVMVDKHGDEDTIAEFDTKTLPETLAALIDFISEEVGDK